jgi:hypothetical protein
MILKFDREDLSILTPIAVVGEKSRLLMQRGNLLIFNDTVYRDQENDVLHPLDVYSEEVYIDGIFLSDFMFLLSFRDFSRISLF